MVDREAPLESLVVADFGRGHSRAYLLEQIAGSFRFVAKAESRTTSDLPYEDLTIGWHHLLRQLEWLSGRGLTTRDRLSMQKINNGDGVDALLVCSTLADPVRVVVLEAGSSPVVQPLLDGLDGQTPGYSTSRRLRDARTAAGPRHRWKHCAPTCLKWPSSWSAPTVRKRCRGSIGSPKVSR
jgi:hypothetical protein